jgi:WD40 repeat protein
VVVVAGYSGLHSCSANLFYVRSQGASGGDSARFSRPSLTARAPYSIAYYTAAVGVVFDGVAGHGNGMSAALTELLHDGPADIYGEQALAALWALPDLELRELTSGSLRLSEAPSSSPSSATHTTTDEASEGAAFRAALRKAAYRAEPIAISGAEDPDMQVGEVEDKGVAAVSVQGGELHVLQKVHTRTEAEIRTAEQSVERELLTGFVSMADVDEDGQGEIPLGGQLREACRRLLTAPRQRFFSVHDADISCLTIHPARELVASAQRSGGTATVATGATVYIWSSSQVGTRHAPEQTYVQRLELPQDESSVCCMGFSADGWLLTVVSTQRTSGLHQARVYDWQKGVLKCSAPVLRGEIPSIYGCVWNPFECWGVPFEETLDGDDDAPPSSWWIDDLMKEMQKLDRKILRQRAAAAAVPEVAIRAASLQPMTERQVLTALICARHADDGVSSFATFGRNTVSFWEYMVEGESGGTIRADKRSPRVGRWSEPSATPAKVTRPSDVLAACYVRKDVLLAGTAAGQVVVFHGCRAVHSTQVFASARRQQEGAAEGQWGMRDGGCSALKLHDTARDRVLGAGGHEAGTLIVDWKIEPAGKQKGTSGNKCPIQLLPQRSVLVGCGRATIVTGLDWHPQDLDQCVLGDSGNDIWAVSLLPNTGDGSASVEQPDHLADEAEERTVTGVRLGGNRERQLIEGQSAPVFGVACHPLRQELIATACEDGHCYLWDSSKRVCVRRIQVTRLRDLPGRRPPELPPSKPWPCGKGELLRVRSVCWGS